MIPKAGANISGSEFFRAFDLAQARRHASTVQPASHQRAALSKLHEWFERDPDAMPTSTRVNSKGRGVRGAAVIRRGGIMVLPTGGGKTFTAARFLCRGPLSQGYKVLWLAHTHHLLNQAYDAFAPRRAAQLAQRGYEVGLIAESRETLRVRVVSGSKGHFSARDIRGDDDVVISTLQTLSKALHDQHRRSGLRAFLKSAPRLVVVFDEAHHSPAPSYRELLVSLSKSQAEMWLLGLTATPVHSDVNKQGWLKKLFPQGILHQVSARKLMADGVLARPVIEHLTTRIAPKWDEREYQKWLGTYRDLPENVVTHLAQNRDRNRLIADTYVKERSRYGKTLIFAERWYQCEQICEFLRARGVRVGALYSHVETQTPGKKRAPDANERTLQEFRDGSLDVLVNVRMLTEGTDVPDVQSVFLTRQTTSRILLAQMVGRALRGPKFGGTERAYIVSFVDDWGRSIPWAEYDDLADAPTETLDAERSSRPPLQMISVELVRRLARQTDSGEAMSASFASLMPVGWYETVFDVAKASDEDLPEDASKTMPEADETDTVRDFTLVFDANRAAFEHYIARLQEQQIECSPALARLAGESLVMDDVRTFLERWHKEFFVSPEDAPEVQKPGAQQRRERDERLRDLLDIARHVAQHDGEAPRFFSFDERQSHDLDALARAHIERDLGVRAVYEALQREYARDDRYWPTLYPNFSSFQLQYNACLARLLAATPTAWPVVAQPKSLMLKPSLMQETSPEVKRQVKKRDGARCLCCGETAPRRLLVDCIVPSDSDEQDAPDNLQTLCKVCKALKHTRTLDFRFTQSALSLAPNGFPDFPLPGVEQARDPEAWKQHLRRRINFFYGCAAVQEVRIGTRGATFYEWEIELHPGNEPAWLRPHLKPLLSQLRGIIAEVRSDKRLVERLIVKSPAASAIAYPIKSLRSRTANLVVPHQ